jgi:streptogramin lyase
MIAFTGIAWFTVHHTPPTASPAGSITEFTVPTANSYPAGIAAGPDGNLWFTENFGNQIGRISPSGTFAEFPIPSENFGSFSLDNPSGLLWIAAGPDGNLWFTESASYKIGRISPSGAFIEISIPTAQGDIEGIAAGPNGNLWFTESNGHKIGRISPSGKITEFPVPTAQSRPNGIAAGSDGNLWFTESNGNKIGRITSGK